MTSTGAQFFYLEADGRERRYLVHKPAGLIAFKPVPAVIMLHGAGASARWTVAETGWGAKADEAEFVAVFPEALPVEPDKPTHITKNPRLWQDGVGVRLEGERYRDDVLFLKLMLDDLIQRFPVDLNQVHVTGFSNGAVMTFRLASEISERLAAIAPVAGYCRVIDPHVARPLPTIFIIGAQDPLVPLQGGSIQSPWGEFRNQPPVEESLAKWAKALGCSPEPRELDSDHGVQTATYGPGNDGVELRVLIVEGQGHHWPGGAGGWSEALAGKRTNHLNATDAIWHFFNQQRPNLI
jgi:polyhydroxybutyrate depolymerase